MTLGYTYSPGSRVDPHITYSSSGSIASLLITSSAKKSPSRSAWNPRVRSTASPLPSSPVNPSSTVNISWSRPWMVIAETLARAPPELLIVATAVAVVPVATVPNSSAVGASCSRACACEMLTSWQPRPATAAVKTTSEPRTAIRDRIRRRRSRSPKPPISSSARPLPDEVWAMLPSHSQPPGSTSDESSSPGSSPHSSSTTPSQSLSTRSSHISSWSGPTNGSASSQSPSCSE